MMLDNLLLLLAALATLGALLAAAAAIADRIGSGATPVPVSAGWATRGGGESLESTIQRADRALFERRRRERG